MSNSDPPYLTIKPNQLQPGTVLRGYEVLGVIGQGGFGLSYKGIDRALERDVVIKEYFPNTLAHRDPDGQTVVPTGEDNYQQGLEFFFQEAQALSQLQHPHIVDVRTVFRANDTAYLVMPYYQGQNLEVWLKEREEPLQERAAFELLRPVLKALDYIHGEKIIHRDVKPANILLAIRGNSQYPVLLDFGGARHFIADATQTFDQILSPGYAPFEQYSRRDQGPWTDVYACGAVLYRMVVGERPPDAMERKGGQPLALDGLSPGFAAVIEKAMAEEPGERLQSIVALEQACEEALQPQAEERGRGRQSPELSSDAQPPERRGLRPLPVLLFLAVAVVGLYFIIKPPPNRTVSDAEALVRLVQRARTGTTIELDGGSYILAETLVITTSLTLRGVGENRPQVSSPTAAPLLRFAPENGDSTLTITNLELAYDGTQAANVLEVEQGRLVVERSQISGAGFGSGGRGIVARDAELSITQSLVHQNEVGLELIGESSGFVAASEISENANGLEVGGGSSATVQGGRIILNSRYGIAVRETGTLEASDVAVNDNASGIFAEGTASLTLRTVTVQNNRVGIHFVDAAGGLVEGNTVTGNIGGIVVNDAATPTISGGNEINGNADFGVSIACGTPIQPDNNIQGNGPQGNGPNVRQRGC